MLSCNSSLPRETSQICPSSINYLLIISSSSSNKGANSVIEQYCVHSVSKRLHMASRVYGHCAVSNHETFTGRRSNLQCFMATKLVRCVTDGRLLLSGFQALVTLTLTFNRVIRHTVVHQSLNCLYISNFIEIGKTSLWTDYPQGPLQLQGRVTQKLGQIAKIQPDQI